MRPLTRIPSHTHCRYGGIVEQEFNVDLQAVLRAETAFFGYTAGTGGGRAGHVIKQGTSIFRGYLTTDNCPGTTVNAMNASNMLRCAPPVAEVRYAPAALPAGYVLGYPLRVLTTDAASYSFVIARQDVAFVASRPGFTVHPTTGFLSPGSGWNASCCGVPLWCDPVGRAAAAAAFANRTGNATAATMAAAARNATCPFPSNPRQRLYVRAEYPNREAFASLIVLDYVIVNNTAPQIEPLELELTPEAQERDPDAVYPAVRLANGDVRDARWAILWQSLEGGYSIDSFTGEFSVLKGAVGNGPVTLTVQVSVPARNNTNVTVGRMAVATNVTIRPQVQIDDPSAGLTVVGVGCPSGFFLVPGDPNTPTSRCFRYVPRITPLPTFNGAPERRGQYAAGASPGRPRVVHASLRAVPPLTSMNHILLLLPRRHPHLSFPCTQTAIAESNLARRASPHFKIAWRSRGCCGSGAARPRRMPGSSLRAWRARGTWPPPTGSGPRARITRTCWTVVTPCGFSHRPSTSTTAGTAHVLTI